MKKNCERCRALEYGFYEWECCLGYRIDSNKAIPLENCPKPKTNIRLVELGLLKSRHGLTLEELANWKF